MKYFQILIGIVTFAIFLCACGGKSSKTVTSPDATINYFVSIFVASSSPVSLTVSSMAWM